MFGYLIVFLFLVLVLFVNLHPLFGGKPRKYVVSKNFKNGKFKNLNKTVINTSDGKTISTAKKFFIDNRGIERVPKKILKTVKFEKDKLIENSFSWFGHSIILMNIDGKKILTDPIFFIASPIHFGGKAFDYTNTPVLDDLPNIDVVVISHDHYDHLNYKTIKKINYKVGKFVVPLGIRSHLNRWKIADNKIVELDWYESVTIDGVKYTLTPSQHFSIRWITRKCSTLWGSWVIKGKKENIFFSGDGGYFSEFKKIGEKYGPFDFAFLENGAYDKNWKNIHIFPEDVVKMGTELGAKHIVPIHWAKYNLAFHSWYEPIERLLIEADRKNVNIVYPQIGEIFDRDYLPNYKWWKELINN